MSNSLFEFFRHVWALICGVISSAIFYFFPIHDIIEVLIIMFVVSFLVGVYHSVAIQHENISKTKGFKAIKEITLYVFFLAGMFLICDKMNSRDAMLQVISTITWGLIYLYTTNILKNLNRICPEYKGVRLLYFILNLEFLRYFPIIKDFEDQDVDKGKKKE